ncbi:11109_t:CDS:2, partial [Acaulospora morrowiae]
MPLQESEEEYMSDVVYSPNNIVSITTSSNFTTVPEFFLKLEVDLDTKVILKPSKTHSHSTTLNATSSLSEDAQQGEESIIYYDPKLSSETLEETNTAVARNLEHQLQRPLGDPRVNRNYAINIVTKRHNFMTESSVRELFEECGLVKDCEIEKNPDNSQSLGIARITYFGEIEGTALNSAREAVIRFNGKQISDGQPVKVELDNDGSKLRMTIEKMTSEFRLQREQTEQHSPINHNKHTTPLPNDIDMEIDEIPSPSPPITIPIKAPLDPPPPRSSENTKNNSTTLTVSSTKTSKEPAKIKRESPEKQEPNPEILI